MTNTKMKKKFTRENEKLRQKKRKKNVKTSVSDQSGEINWATNR